MNTETCPVTWFYLILPECSFKVVKEIPNLPFMSLYSDCDVRVINDYADIVIEYMDKALA